LYTKIDSHKSESIIQKFLKSVKEDKSKIELYTKLDSQLKENEKTIQQFIESIKKEECKIDLYKKLDHHI
jgi:predicted aldo/keto reductase-like oxidoreductase